MSDHSAPPSNPTGAQSVRIVTDSSCDLPASIADDLSITIVPLTIRFGDDEFIDRDELVEVTPDAVRVRKRVLAYNQRPRRRGEERSKPPPQA